MPGTNELSVLKATGKKRLLPIVDPAIWTAPEQSDLIKRLLDCTLKYQNYLIEKLKREKLNLPPHQLMQHAEIVATKDKVKWDFKQQEFSKDAVLLLKKYYLIQKVTHSLVYSKDKAESTRIERLMDILTKNKISIESKRHTYDFVHRSTKGKIYIDDMMKMLQDNKPRLQAC